MNAIISRLLREATAPIVESSMRLVQKAVLVLFGVISLFVSWIFITVAFYGFLQPLIGHADAALSVAGLYLFAALLFLFSAKRQTPGRARRPLAAERTKLMQDTSESNVAPFLNMLYRFHN